MFFRFKLNLWSILIGLVLGFGAFYLATLSIVWGIIITFIVSFAGSYVASRAEFNQRARQMKADYDQQILQLGRDASGNISYTGTLGSEIRELTLTTEDGARLIITGAQTSTADVSSPPDEED